ncbi:hypothetical protein BGZ63DRAFT_376661 [Mariannaea sp. PMI_226]|nr:hypothetical protein BGZ63DRAFT_376661 [Mariannaea sp. PMI_226]
MCQVDSAQRPRALCPITLLVEVLAASCEDQALPFPIKFKRCKFSVVKPARVALCSLPRMIGAGCIILPLRVMV